MNKIENGLFDDLLLTLTTGIPTIGPNVSRQLNETIYSYYLDENGLFYFEVGKTGNPESYRFSIDRKSGYIDKSSR